MTHELGTPMPVRAARGSRMTALGWPQEAAMRMLANNLDPEVAENPDELVVYGGTGRAARDWPSFRALMRTLATLQDDETMLVQSGRPVGVMRTHEWAPRVLIANSNLVGDWANWPEFRRLEALGLTMYGQMTAGSWIYIGTQGILQGTFETFAAVAQKHFGSTLAGTLTLTAGCGGMGGAQPLAVTLNDGACLIVDVDGSRLARRVKDRYLDEWTDDLDIAVEKVLAAKSQRKGWSVGVVGNAAEVLPELLRRGVPVDIVTDQTSAHDPLSYLPIGISFEDWHLEAERDPQGFTERSLNPWPATSRPWWGSWMVEPRSSTMATAFAARRWPADSPGPSTSQVSYPRTYDLCSARVRARSGGPRCPATPRTSQPPIGPSWNCSPTMTG